jgi:hypothetical protein
MKWQRNKVSEYIILIFFQGLIINKSDYLQQIYKRLSNENSPIFQKIFIAIMPFLSGQAGKQEYG